MSGAEDSSAWSGRNGLPPGRAFSHVGIIALGVGAVIPVSLRRCRRGGRWLGLSDHIGRLRVPGQIVIRIEIIRSYGRIVRAAIVRAVKATAKTKS